MYSRLLTLMMLSMKWWLSWKWHSPSVLLYCFLWWTVSDVSF